MDSELAGNDQQLAVSAIGIQHCPMSPDDIRTVLWGYNIVDLLIIEGGYWGCDSLPGTIQATKD